MKDRNSNNSNLVVISDLFFVLLPFLVVTILNCASSNYRDIFYGKDISFISIVLLGQSIVKFVSGLTNTKQRYRWQIISFIVSIIVVLNILSVVILMMVYFKHPSIWFYLIQTVLGIISIIVYYTIGTVSQILFDKNNTDINDNTI